MKRIPIIKMICVVLSLWMLAVLVLTSCADAPTEENNPAEPGEQGSEGTTEETPSEPDKEKEEVRLPLDYLPTEKYKGVTVNFLEWSVGGHTPGMSWVPWEEIDVDAADGDPLHNAIYDRNGYIEETYEVEITKEYLSIDGSPAYLSHFRSASQAGDQTWQVITLRTLNIASLINEGLMKDMNTLSNLHTDMPWWNQDSVQSFTTGKALFFAAPEMLLRDKGATSAMFYNQTVAAQYEIVDLYDLASSGEWTMDAMIEYGEQVTEDLDGDDQLNSAEDMFGLSGSQRSIPFHMFAGTDNKLAIIDQEGYLQNAIDDDVIDIWQTLLDEVMYTDFYTGTNVDSSTLPDKDFDFFKADKALFYIDMVKSVNTLRDMTSDYGVLPIPKYDEYQEDYSTLVWTHHDCVLGIPSSVTNEDAVSTVLEHMNYISYYDVYPLFYDTIILGKSARDAQSKEMLQLIFRVRSFDPGQYWLSSTLHGSGGFLTLVEQNKRNIASVWAGIEKQTMTEIEKFNDRVDEKW